MARATDSERIRLAQFSGRASRIRGKVWQSNPAAVATSRAALPEVWEAIDALIDLVDWR